MRESFRGYTKDLKHHQAESECLVDKIIALHSKITIIKFRTKYTKIRPEKYE